MKRLSCMSFVLFTLVAGGCDESINPAAPFEPRMVIYSILNTQSDSQFVRISTTYEPPDNDALKNPDERSISDATVTVTDGVNTFPFLFASVTRPDTSRYKSKIGLYYAYPFRPQANKEYRLNVTSPTLGKATAKTVVPGSGFVATSSVFELTNPITRNSIFCQFSLNNLAKAWLVRFYIIYTTENPGEEGKEKYYEVPIFWKILDYNLEMHKRIFPSVATASSTIRAGQLVTQTREYPYPAYNESIYQIAHNNFNVRFKRAVFYLIQFNEPWYKHYASGNLFQDRLGVRLDPPDYSNIEGGFGLFGSLRVDSTVVPLPEYIPPYR